MVRASQFDPDKVAYAEKAGWEAYYDRNWPRAFWLLVQLNREAFGMGWLVALIAALDVVRATIAFAPVENDVGKAKKHLARFYARARRSLGIGPAAETLADLELRYWVVHRELAERRKQNHADDDIEPMIEALTTLHAALFSSDEKAMRPSAVYRAQAAKAVDRITGKYSTDVAADWREVEAYLQKAYRAVEAAQQSKA